MGHAVALSEAAQLDDLKSGVFSSGMGRLLEKLLSQSSVFDVRWDEGFVLTAKPGQSDEFSDLVRQAAEQAGDDFIVFTTGDGHHGYSQMFVLPFDPRD